jgi:hypothetical protein
MPVVAVFGASVAERGGPLWNEAVRCGRLLAEEGLTVATGGYGGVMEAVSEGAAAAGGHVIGVTAPSVFPGRDGANGHVTVEYQSSTIGARIVKLVELADAWIALPGSLGTATELLVAWNYAYVARFSGTEPGPLYAVGEPWATLVPLLAAGLGTEQHLVRVVADVEQAATAVAAEFRRRRQDQRQADP